ncbi:unnamed protein product, partial [Prorocentrum cordatum]
APSSRAAESTLAWGCPCVSSRSCPAGPGPAATAPRGGGRPCSGAGAGGDCGGYPPPDLSRAGTADLADLFLGDVHACDALRTGPAGTRRVAAAVGEGLGATPPPRGLPNLGGRSRFSGRVATVQCFESNLVVRSVLSESGGGRVLVVDAGGSPRAALFGDNLGELAVRNGWAGVLLHGFLRDAACLRGMPLGVKALGTYPVKTGGPSKGHTSTARSRPPSVDGSSRRRARSDPSLE